MGRVEVAALLEDARSLRSSFVQRDPDVTSLARYELDHAPEVFGSALPVERLVHCVDLWTVITSDQLYGLARLIDDGSTVFPIFPILRSVIEHSAWIAWVLDDQRDGRHRAARAALAVLRSQEELNKAASRMGGKGSATQQDAKARLKRLRVEVGDEFGSLVLEPLKLEGELLPSPTEVIESFGTRWGDAREWIGMYDYLCGTANHPSLNADEYFDLSDPSCPCARISDDFLNRLLRAGLVPYLKSLEYFCAYMGWSTRGLDAYIDRVNETLGVILRSTDQRTDSQQSAQ